MQGGAIYAGGLNQITRAGAAGVGVAAADAQDFLDTLVTLSVAQQIPYVERSLKTSLAGAGVANPGNVGLLYAVNFLPARVRERGTAPGTVLTTKGEKLLRSTTPDSTSTRMARSLSRISPTRCA